MSDALSSTPYTAGILALFDGAVNWEADTIKVALVKNTYTPSAEHEAFAGTISTHEASGAGYTAGGATLANCARTVTGGVIKYTADTLLWESLNISDVLYAVVWADDGADGIPLVCIALAASVLSTTSEGLQLWWNAAGILFLGPAA